MNTGDLVAVRVYGGEIVHGRVVVEVHARGVLVCRAAEWEASKRERREPVVVGFPVEDVLPDDQRSSAVPT